MERFDGVVGRDRGPRTEDEGAKSSTARRRLTRSEIDRLARDEMPELTVQLRLVRRHVARLQSLSGVDQQFDLDGLHRVVDRELLPLLVIHRGHYAVDALAEMIEHHPGIRPPLLTKVALLSLLT